MIVPVLTVIKTPISRGKIGNPIWLTVDHVPITDNIVHRHKSAILINTEHAASWVKISPAALKIYLIGQMSRTNMKNDTSHHSLRFAKSHHHASDPFAEPFALFDQLLLGAAVKVIGSS